jgi:hypothetical protein
MSIASTAIHIGEELLEDRQVILTDKTRSYIVSWVCTVDRLERFNGEYVVVGNVDLVYVRPMMGEESDYPEYITLKRLLDLFFDCVFKYTPM